MKKIRVDKCKRFLRLKIGGGRYYVITTVLEYTDLNTNKHYTKKYSKKYKSKLRAYRAFENKKNSFLNKEVIRLHLEELF